MHNIMSDIMQLQMNEISFVKSNQITFIVTSSQHMCLDEWNSWERAPYSAETINI